MRETCKTPTTSLDGVPHDHTLPRHSRAGGNPRRCDRTHGGTALLLQSTEFDRIRQNPTETRVRAYPKFTRACAREGKRDSRLRGNDVGGRGNDGDNARRNDGDSARGNDGGRITVDLVYVIPPGLVIPAKAGISRCTVGRIAWSLRHSAGSRHSREGGNLPLRGWTHRLVSPSFRRVSSFPRRRESPVARLDAPPGLSVIPPGLVIPAKAGISRCTVGRIAWSLQDRSVVQRGRIE